ncbi:substrate-binding domain-containing protein, partial [Bifidobacterium myosotis]
SCLDAAASTSDYRSPTPNPRKQQKPLIFHFSYNTGDDAADVGNLIDATFKSHPNISAILSATNLIHMNNAIVSLRKRGLSVPGDVSFIALCMQGDANNLDVPVDEFPLLPSETCADAVDLMMSVLDGNEHKRGEVKLIPPHYLDRGRSRCVRINMFCALFSFFHLTNR